MSRCISVIISVTVPNGVSDEEAGESLFDTLAEYASEDLIETVDGWEPR